MTNAPQLHPSIKMFLEGLTATPLPAFASMDAPTLRQIFDQPFPIEPVSVAQCSDLEIPSTNGGISARQYSPENNSDRVIVFFHGGGFVMGTLDTHDNFCRYLCTVLNSVVISVDYRLAPEHPFPAALDDCYHAVQWAADNSAQWTSGNVKITLAGDSAGAGLCAAVSLKSRKQRGPSIDSQLLFYPTVQPPQDNESYRTLGTGDYFLSTDMMDYFWNAYLAKSHDRNNSLAIVSLEEDLSNLPTTHVVLAEFDPLKDEGRGFTQRLKDAGNTVSITTAQGMIHGFMTMPGVDQEVRQILEDIKKQLT